MNDDDRYIQYLQKQLLSEGYEDFFRNPDSTTYIEGLRSVA